MDPIQVVLSVIATLLVIFTSLYLVYYLKERGLNAKSLEDKITDAVQQVKEAVLEMKPLTTSFNAQAVCKEFLGTNKFSSVEFGNGLCMYEYFTTQLIQHGYELTVYRRNAGEMSSADVVLQIVKDDVRFLIMASSTYHTGLKPEAFKPNDFFNPNEWTVKDTALILHGMTIITPLEECDEDCQIVSFDDIGKLYQQSLVSFAVAADAEDLQTIEIYTLQGGGMQGASFKSMPVTLRALNDDLLGNSYEKARINISGNLHAVPMNLTTEFIQDLIKANENVMVLGSTGTGKTTLCGDIIQGLDPKTTVVAKLDYATLVELQKPEGRAALSSFVQRMKSWGKKQVVYWIDEGQAISGATREVNAALLELMEGANKNLGLPSATLVAINAQEKDLDPALLSRCRHLVTLLPLSRDMAIRLREKIKHARPDLSFDHKQFDKSFNDKTIYSPQESITLREVWACFQPKSRSEKWSEALKAYKVQPVSRQPVPQPPVKK
jgi:energy-coupling factor transporter ATP-binding protein EcfA2